MNTNLIASLLLPFAAATLSAQELKFEATASTRAFTATAKGATEGSMVIMVLGLAPASISLPDGQLLGVQPDMLLGFVLARTEAPAAFHVDFPRDLGTFIFFAQAVALQPRLPMNAPGAITLSSPQKLQTADR